jgi:ELWxxDGT repeat protein
MPSLAIEVTPVYDSRSIPQLHWILLPWILFFTTLLLPGLAGAMPQRIPIAPLTLVETPYQPSDLVQLGESFYFEAYDPQHGRELWVSDGSEPGTRRLTDLCPGACDARIDFMRVLGGRLFFLSSEFATDTLQVLDGDQLSTVGRVPGRVREMVAAGDALYLQVDSGGSTSILRSRGDADDLEPFLDICGTDGGNCTVYTRIESLEGHIFFLKDGYFQRLSPAGVAERLAEADQAQLIGSAAGGRFFFWVCRSSGCAIYSSDGTAAGTAVPPGGDSVGGFLSFQVWHGKLYWGNADGWLTFTDGFTTTVTAAAADSLIGATPGHLFFIRRSDYPDHVLFSLSTGGTYSQLSAFRHFDPKVVGVLGESIFLAIDGTSLHFSDGTPAGTRQLGDLVWQAHDSAATIAGRLYAPAYHLGSFAKKDFYTFDAAGNGQRTLPPRLLPWAEDAEALANTSVVAKGASEAGGLWRVDPQTLAVTAMPAPALGVRAASGDRLLVNGAANQPPFYGITPNGSEILPIERPIAFADGDGGRFYWGEAVLGEVLWESDGTLAGSRPLFDFSPGLVQPPCSYHCTPRHPSSLRVDGDRIYLVAKASPGSDEAALWVYDRVKGLPTRLLTFQEAFYTSRPVLHPVGDRMVLSLGNPETYGNDLWVTDGTPEGTYLLHAYDSGRGELTVFGAAGGRLFLRDDRDRLFASDLAPGHLDLLLDQPGLSLWAFIGAGTAAVGDRFFFVAHSPELGVELWTSDGTPAGTRPLDLRPGPLGSWPSSLLGVGERLVLAADRGSHGMELYQSDGTPEGTSLLADLAPGETPSSPSAIRAVGERLFFTADDGTTGRGLWSLDLPPARPSCPQGRLCLQNGRFEVAVTAQGQDLVEGSRVLASAESGVFSFFSPNNWELLVKVLDGCAINQRFWVYTAAATDVPFTLNVVDRATGEQWEQRHPGGGPAPPKLDGNAFATCGEPAPSSAWSAILPEAPAAPRCADDLDAFCFGSGGRFRAKASWHTAGDAGVAKTAFAGSFDSGIFTFFSPSNWELMVKVLDGCAINGKHWVFVAATTDVGWDLEIEDQLTGQIRRYENVRGSARAAVNDSGAFACN